MTSLANCLIYSTFQDSQFSPLPRVLAKMLASSILRNHPEVELIFGRSNVGPHSRPLFKVGRSGLIECDDPLSIGHKTPFREWIDPVKYEWIIFVDSGCLVLRNLDLLLQRNADLVWAPILNCPIRNHRFNGFLSPLELDASFTSPYPVSRPWYAAASPSLWAVRGECYTHVMEVWNSLLTHPTANRCAASFRLHSSWNRLLLDSQLRIKPIEKGEVSFPTFDGITFLDWKDSALICVNDWPITTQAQFLQAVFYGFYYGDTSGLFLDILEV